MSPPAGPMDTRERIYVAGGFDARPLTMAARVVPSHWRTRPAQEGGEQMRGAVFEHGIEWNDPRLPSLMRLHENVNIHFVGDEDAVWSWLGSVRLEGEEGAWTGAEYGLGEESDEGLVLQPRMMLLAGEGAYEGLSAMLQRQYEVITTASRPVFEGYIYEGELPPMPEPLEPLTE